MARLNRKFLKKKIASGQCLHDTNKAITRGVCHRCRQAIRAYQIGKGLTDEDLVKAGYLLERKGRGPKPASGFAKRIGA